MNYTKQNELGIYGERWGCFFTCLINIWEMIEGVKMPTEQLWTTIGYIMLRDYPGMFLANYKHHDLKNYHPGWSYKANPEWHFYINSVSETLKSIFYIGGTLFSRHPDTFEIWEYNTGSGSHFVLWDGQQIINPDPVIDLGLIQKIGTRQIVLPTLIIYE